MNFFNITICDEINTQKNKGLHFYINKDEATDEFIKAANYVSQISGTQTISHISQEAEIIYIQSEKNETLIIKTKKYTRLYRDPERGFAKSNKIREFPRIEYHIYEDAVAWNYSKKDRNEFNDKFKVTGFPCSMRDFFYYQNPQNIEYDIFRCLFNSWSKQFIIWKDLKQDFEQGCAYSSIPLKTINSCNNRREIIEKHYHCGQKRNNKENIGNGIFFAKLKAIVEPTEIQKLYGCKCPPCFINREKKKLIYPLATILYCNFKQTFKSMNCNVHNNIFTLKQDFIEDAIETSIELRRKIPLTFKTVKSVKNWHDYLFVLQRNKKYPVMEIPKSSIFKTLKLPDNCVRLTTRKQMVEEGIYQHNCVASYIDSVNRDDCSIWSMRKSDGIRNTIEICMRTSKENPKGYFFIKQMTGFDNTNVDKEDWDEVKQAIDRCKPYQSNSLKS